MELRNLAASVGGVGVPIPTALAMCYCLLDDGALVGGRDSCS